MKKALYSILLLLLIAGVFLAGSWYGRRGAIKPPDPGADEIVRRKQSTHSAHPVHTPGNAPASTMSAEPVHVHGRAANTGEASASMSPGAVSISPVKQQLIGVRVSPVEKASETQTVRILGRVAPDERKIYKLNAGVDGFIREVSEVTTGSLVQKDQWLATFSAPESRQPIQGFLVTLSVLDRSKQSGTETPVQIGTAEASSELAIDRLLNLGMSRVQIEEIRRTRHVPTNIRILAPADGFVLARNVSPGQKFEKGGEWYQIADLSRIWIFADLYGSEAQYFRPGMKVKVSLPDQGKAFQARVSGVLPQFNPATRTLKLRLEADNPDYTLRPDMFVDVELPVQLPPAITVPGDAIIHSGMRKIVFVDRGNGLFEPREVETGWRMGNRVEIVKGLEAGERIVTSGTFLIDSESKLEAAAQGMYTTLSKDPVCGIDVAMRKAEKAGLKASHGGKTYYFHAEECKQKFEKDPKHYAEKPAQGDSPSERIPSPKSQETKGHGHG